MKKILFSGKSVRKENLGDPFGEQLSQNLNE